jgi:CBS-domain-containing membrane protein
MRTWKVDDVMTVDVVAVGEDALYREIVDILTDRCVSAVPVTDEDRRVVGVVSEADLLHKIEFVGSEPERRVFASRRRRTAEAKARGLLARELMSAPAITVAPRTSLAVAAKLMDDERVKRLPVVDAMGRLVGIVTRSDLLRVYLRPDSEIEHDVIDEVLDRTLLVERGSVIAQVRDGVVTLTGRADRYSTARLAVKLTQAVPGVVEVVDRLEFSFDDRKLAGAGHYTPAQFGMH